jgi:hypothetical protein
MSYIFNMLFCVGMILLNNLLQCLLFIAMIDISKTSLIYYALVMFMIYSWIKIKLKVLIYLSVSPSPDATKVSKQLKEGSMAKKVIDVWVNNRRNKGHPWCGPLPPLHQSPLRTLGDALVNAKIKERRCSSSSVSDGSSLRPLHATKFFYRFRAQANTDSECGTRVTKTGSRGTNMSTETIGDWQWRFTQASFG